jgi:acetyl esterase/lipase
LPSPESRKDLGVSRRAHTTSIHRYGDDESQLTELFLPDGTGPHPVVVVVHGGYWRARYDRSLMTQLCVDLAEHGLAAWNLEYRRVGAGGGWPETLLDVAAGVDALADTDAPLDLDRVAAVGHSAGGQLAVWAAGRPRLPLGATGAGPRVEIGAVVSQAGVLDLRLAAALDPSAEPTRALLGDPAENAEAYDIASPASLLPLRIPQLVLHGDRDETVSLRIAESYAARARDMGDPCEFVVLPGTGHFEHIEAGSDAWRMAREWLASYASAARS